MVIGKPWESVFSVIDRRDGVLKEIEEPQSEITCDFFTGLDELMDAPENNDGVAGAAATTDDANRPATTATAIPAANEEMKDNRNLSDNNTAQKMKHADVELLKE